MLTLKNDLVGKRVLCFSYGSGCAASMFSLRVGGIAHHPADLIERLEARSPKSVDVTQQIIQSYEDSYGRFGFQPSSKYAADRQHNAFYLSDVSAEGVRVYEQHQRSRAIKVTKLKASNITCIEFLNDIIDGAFVQEVISALDEDSVHIFSSACVNFNVGASSGGGKIDEQNILFNSSEFSELHRRLEALELPTIAVCHGATRGGGMLFPAIADVVIATEDATFGFPEIRRGVLPWLVSVSSRRRLSERECKRLMMTGNTIDSSTALSMGFVDVIDSGSRDGAYERAMLWASTMSTSLTMWRRAKSILRNNCDINFACVEAGSDMIDISSIPQSIIVKWHGSHIADIELPINLNWGAICNLELVVSELVGHHSLRAVIIHGVECNFGNAGDFDEWMTSGTGGADTFAGNVAALYRGVSVCCDTLRKLLVPTIAVLQGHVSGAGLALALSADLRVAAASTSFGLGEGRMAHLLNLAGTLGVISGNNKILQLLTNSIDSKLAMSSNIITHVFDNIVDAGARALQIAQSLGIAPRHGVRNTLQLLWPTTDTIAKCERCVRHLFVDDQSVGSLTRRTTPTDFLGHLVRVSCEGDVKSIVLDQDAFHDLDDIDCFSEGFLSLMLWFASTDRPKVVLHCDGPSLSILPSLICDEVVASAGTSFRTNSLSRVMWPSIFPRIRFSGLIEIIRNEGPLLAASGLVLLGGFSYFDGKCKVAKARKSTNIGVVFDASRSLCEAVLNEWKREESQELPHNVQIDGGGAQIIVTTPLQTLKAIEYIKKLDHPFNSIIFDARHVHDDVVNKKATFKELLQHFSSLARIQQEISCLNVPTYSLFDGLCSSLGAVLALSSHSRIATPSTAFNFDDLVFRAAIFYVTDALPTLIGRGFAESLRMEGGLLASATALTMGLVTEIHNDLNDFKLDVEGVMTFGVGISPTRYFANYVNDEMFGHCLHIARSLAEPFVASNASKSYLDVTMRGDIISTIKLLAPLSTNMLCGLIAALEPTSRLHFVFVNGNGGEIVAPDDWLAFSHVASTFEFPFVVVCGECCDEELEAMIPLLAEADFVFLAELGATRLLNMTVETNEVLQHYLQKLKINEPFVVTAKPAESAEV